MTRSIQSNPTVSLSIIAAQTAIGTSAQRVLFVGQKTAVGTATSGALISDIQNDASENTLFGANSMLAGMIRAFRAINLDVNIDAIPLDDAGAGVPATSTVTFAGTPTEAGTITITVGSRVNHAFKIAIATTDTATTIAAALVTAITADTDVPVTAGNVAGVVTLTAVNDGTEGNSIGIAKSGTVGGVTTTLVGMASGATNPTLTGVFDVVGDIRYQTVVWPFTFTLTELKSFLDPRFNVDNKIQDGVGIVHSSDTFANLKSAGDAENSQSIVILGNREVTGGDVEGSGLLEIGTIISSQFAALRSLRLEDDTNIAPFVIATNGARDTRGGAAIASLPYHNTPFVNLPVVTQGDGFTAQELSDLLDAGVSNIGSNITATIAIAGPIKTTSKTDVAGNPDPSFGFLNFVDTISTIREIYFNRLKARYAQSRLTTGALQSGRSIANEESIRAFLIGIYQDLGSADFVLVEAGETSLNFFKDNLSVVLDLVTGTATITMKVLIVTQLRIITGSIQIAFSTEE